MNEHTHQVKQQTDEDLSHTQVSDKRGWLYITISVVHDYHHRPHRHRHTQAQKHIKLNDRPPLPHPEVLKQQLHDLVTVRQDVGHQSST